MRCPGGCLGLFDEVVDIPPPRDGEDPLGFGEIRAEMEPSEGGGVGPLEGCDAEENERSVSSGISEPPAGWLSSLWEGGPLDG